MSNLDLLYMRGVDGKFYLEIPNEHGESHYEEAEPGLAFRELPNGKYIAVRDTAEARRQAEGSSHMRYFESLKKDGPAGAKQGMKRVASLERQLQQMQIDMVTPVAGVNVRIIKDAEFMSLTEEYRLAVLKGEHKNHPFQPFVAYAHKLVTSSGKQVRAVMKGEVGMQGSQILVLEPGYGEGTQVSVPEEIK